MAAGVPSVATDVGACREVLDGGCCSRLLVEPGSPEAPAAGIQAVLVDPTAARNRAEARERALREFSVAAMVESYGEELGLTRFGTTEVAR